MGQRDRKVAAAGLLVLGAGLAWAGSAALPVSSHEVLVLRTAQEMQARGDWLMPWYCGAPRLTKPPLPYWLTGLASRLLPAEPPVAAWHGRLVAALSALAVVFLVRSLAGRLFGPVAGDWAALFWLTSAGFLLCSHSARPDMLYTALCVGGLTAFVAALTAADRAQEARRIFLMWGSYGLATLAKGPHVPLFFLAGSAVYAGRQRGGARHAWALLRPGRGVLLWLALALPWWVALEVRLRRMGLSLVGTELLGRDLRPRSLALPSPFPLRAFLQLLLPWVTLLPLLARRSSRPQGTGAVLLPAAVLLGALCFGFRQRLHYALPAVPLAAAALAGALTRSHRRPWPRWFVVLHGLGAAAAVAGLAYYHAAYGAPLPGEALGAALLVGVGLTVWAARRPAPLRRQVAAAAGVTAVAVAALGASGGAWPVKRWHRLRLARAAVRRDAHLPLAALGTPRGQLVYVSRRAVAGLAGTGALQRFLARSHGGPALVLTTRAWAYRLRRRFRVREVAAAAPLPGGKQEVLLLVADSLKPSGRGSPPGCTGTNRRRRGGSWAAARPLRGRHPDRH